MHSCPTMLTTDAFIELQDGELLLTLSKVATAEDLENNHYLNFEGELKEQVAIPVAYCPYCGERLTSTSVAEATYQHFKFC